MKRLTVEIPDKLMEEIKIKIARDQTSLRIFVTRAVLAELHRKNKEKK